MQDVHSRIIAEQAKVQLAPMGVVRKGRSRTWIDDHGWWLVNVEFQPSSHGRGCYLNVGEQHLWIVRDYLCFELFERPLGGTAFVEFTGDEQSFAAEMRSVVQAAASAIERRRHAHGDDIAALRRLAEGEDDLNAGIAWAILGDAGQARRRLTGQIHQAFEEVAASYLADTAGEAQARAWSAVQSTRSSLRLAPTSEPEWV